VTPLLLIGLGLAALGAGVGVLLSFGERYRIGRLLASVPAVPIAEAIRLARAAEPRYVRIDGRIDSEQEFEDAEHRPLVLRRTTFEAGGSSGLRRWRAFERNDEVVPFELHEGLEAIAIDRAALGGGLVVVPRQSSGVAADLGDRAPPSLLPATPVRVTIQQVSSVEHASVLGSPIVDGSGTPTMTAGLGRPLILTTLEIPEAMRILTGGAVGRSRLSAACLVAGTLLLAVGAGWWLLATVFSPAAALGASPLPSILPGSDTRSSGQGPGLVGDPAMAILGVAGIGLIALLATLAYVRLTSNRP
jgi:hypothetical protein